MIEQSNDIVLMDFTNLLYTPQAAADLLNLSTATLKNIERDSDLEIQRVERGSVLVRAYSLDDVFRIAAIRREKGFTKGLAAPLTVSVYVQKGGTGKTTCTTNIAIHLALAGLRVLIIDNDPQGDLSSMLGYDPDLTADELEELSLPGDRAVDGHFGNLLGVSNMFEKKNLDQVLKKPFGQHGPHLIASEVELEDLDLALMAATNPDFRYASFIQRARAGQVPGCDLSNYDIILFDNPPSGSRLTRNAMVACDLLICPVRMDKFSFKALVRLANNLEVFRQDFGRSPAIKAIPTMFHKSHPRSLNNLSRLAAIFPGCVTETCLYHSGDYPRALEEGVPTTVWRGTSRNTANAMREVFEETFKSMRAIASTIAANA